MEREREIRVQVEADMADLEAQLTKQKAVNKKLKEHVERAKTDMGELKDKCEVLEEEYQAVKK